MAAPDSSASPASASPASVSSSTASASAPPAPASPGGLPAPSESGSIAHDLRNLLNAANINLHLVMRKADDPESVRRWTTKSIEALAAANVMITERLSRQKGAPPAVFAAAKGLDVDARLEAMRPMFARALPRTAVDYALAAGGAQAACDGDSLEAAVFNLAVNAREAMAGAGRIALATRAIELNAEPGLAAGRYIELKVRDHGPGLPAEIAADPFAAPPQVQADAGSGSEKGSGAGESADAAGKSADAADAADGADAAGGADGANATDGEVEEEAFEEGGDDHAELRAALAQVQAFARAAGGIARVTQSDAQGTEITLWLKAV